MVFALLAFMVRLLLVSPEAVGRAARGRYVEREVVSVANRKACQTYTVTHMQKRADFFELWKPKLEDTPFSLRALVSWCS